MSEVMLVVVVLLLSGLTSQAQSVQDYDAHLARLHTSILSWQAQIKQIDPAQLNVTYSAGKLIDQYKDIVMKNIDIADLYATNIPRKRSLGSEIELLGILKEIHCDMDALSSLLADQNNQKAQSWGEQIGGISSGSLDSEEQYQRTSVEHFADELERRCGPAQ